MIINGNRVGADKSVGLFLPANVDKNYNNKYLAIDCDRIYEDLLVNNKNWIK